MRVRNPVREPQMAKSSRLNRHLVKARLLTPEKEKFTVPSYGTLSRQSDPACPFADGSIGACPDVAAFRASVIHPELFDPTRSH